MENATTIRFELVSSSGRQMHGVFARVVNLLMSATLELEHSQEAAKSSICRAASLLQAQMRYENTGRQAATLALLAWQMRRVESYIDAHIEQQILVANLSELLDLSEAHFSRLFAWLTASLRTHTSYADGLNWQPSSCSAVASPE